MEGDFNALDHYKRRNRFKLAILSGYCLLVIALVAALAYINVTV